MESNIVKCSQCNIVISEVLSFVQNKIDIMNNESLIQICKTSFSEEEVKTAKSLLFQAIPSSKRMITRKSKGKVVRDLEDIINLFKQTEPEIIPVFVAHDLQKLPPITFDHVDVTALLKNILVLQSEVKYLKENMVTHSQAEEFRNRKYHGLQYPTDSLKETSQDKINHQRGAVMLDESSYLEMCESNCNDQLVQSKQTNKLNTDAQANTRSTPEHKTQVDSTAQGHVGASSSQPLALARSTRESVSLARVPVQSQRVEANAKITAISTDRNHQLVLDEASECVQQKMAERVDCDLTQQSESHEKSWANIAREGEWKQVVYKRRMNNRFRGNKGIAAPLRDSNFKAADIRIMFYIYNVNQNSTAEDIREYVFFIYILCLHSSVGSRQ